MSAELGFIAPFFIVRDVMPAIAGKRFLPCGSNAREAFAHRRISQGMCRKRDSRASRRSTVQICLTWRDKSSDHRPTRVHNAGFSTGRKENLTSTVRSIANVSFAAHLCLAHPAGLTIEKAS